MSTGTRSGIAIEAVNALGYEKEIKQLFLEHDRPEFPDFFDRAYPTAFANGATSWLGRDGSGRLVMHIACMPRRFRFRGPDVVVGLLANLMVAKEYRSFFPALTLLTRLIQDSKAGGTIDFLFADPNEESRALLKGTRFCRIATLRRYVMAVSDPRPPVALGIRLLHGVLRLLNSNGRASRVIARPATEFQPNAFWVPHQHSRRLSAYHDEALYRSRMAGFPGPADWWFTCHDDNTASPAAAALIRGPDATGLAALYTIRRRPGVPVISVFPGIVRELRRRGCKRLQVLTVEESEFAGMLRRCGFMPRHDMVPMFGLPLTPLGEECIAATREWEITDLECDR